MRRWQGVLVHSAHLRDAGSVGSRQVLLGPPHRNEIAPFRAPDEGTEWGGFGYQVVYSDPRNASKFAESVEFNAS